MQFLKILFWFLLAFVAALFTYGNWTGVQINLWSGLIADVNLPLLLLVTFLLGFLPTYLYLAACERLLVDQRATTVTPAPVAAEPVEPTIDGRPA
jgi:putative membrane protein